MAEEKLIQINLQLPVSELAGITALVEQVRQLLAAGEKPAAGTAAPERSTSFDEDRFRELEKASQPADRPTDSSMQETAENTFENSPNAKTGSTFAFADIVTPPSQKDPAWQPLQANAVSASAETDIIVPQQDTTVTTELSVEAMNAEVENEPDISTPDVAAGQDLDTVVSVASVESDINAESLLMGIETDIQTDTMRTDVENEIGSPTTANFPAPDYISPFLPERQWNAEQLIAADPSPLAAEAGFAASDNISSFLPERQRDAEQLVAAGPAPLTAEAVSLAFRRDDRRYDNGFPLY